MKVYNKKEYIEAMKHLITEYSLNKHEYNVSTCCLCKISNVERRGQDNCNSCPWIVLTNNLCVKSKNNIERISQLCNWIKIYEEAEEIEDFQPFIMEFSINTIEEASFWKSIIGNTSDKELPNSGEVYNRYFGIRTKLDDIDLTSYDPFEGNSFIEFKQKYFKKEK